MKKEEREQVMEQLRHALRPLLESGAVTQDEVAERLSELGGRAVDQSTVSRWLDKVTPQNASMPAIRHMLAEVQQGGWPSRGRSRSARQENHANHERHVLRETVAGSRQSFEHKAPRAPDQPAAGADILRALWTRLDAIDRELDLSPTTRLIRREQELAAYRQVIQDREARAAEGRARAIEAELEVAASRMNGIWNGGTQPVSPDFTQEMFEELISAAASEVERRRTGESQK